MGFLHIALSRWVWTWGGRRGLSLFPPLSPRSELSPPLSFDTQYGLVFLVACWRLLRVASVCEKMCGVGWRRAKRNTFVGVALCLFSLFEASAHRFCGAPISHLDEAGDVGADPLLCMRTVFSSLTWPALNNARLAARGAATSLDALLRSSQTPTATKAASFALQVLHQRFAYEHAKVVNSAFPEMPGKPATGARARRTREK